MSLQNLDNLVQRGLLQKEPAHKDEVNRLLAAAKEVAELQALAAKLRAAVLAWIAANQPELL
jgi:hypothetical protein